MTISPLLKIKSKIEGPRGFFDSDNYWYGYLDDFKYTIGLPGLKGFGVGCCRPELLPDSFAPMDGCYDRFSPNYGNYIHTPSASIMCFIPAHYIDLKPAADTAKFFGNEIIISDTPVGNAVLARSFLDAGIELAGVFVDKYQCCNVVPNGSGAPNHSSGLAGGDAQDGGIAASRPSQWPLSFSTSTASSVFQQNSIITRLTSKALNPSVVTPLGNLNGAYNACRTRGQEFNLMPTWVRSQIAYLSAAHTQALLDTSGVPIQGSIDNAAWMDVAPYSPKGNTSDGLDFNKSSLSFSRTDIGGIRTTSLGFAGSNSRAFTGAARISNLPATEHTTHNGQLSGIVDVSGNQSDVCGGFAAISISTNNFQSQYVTWPSSLSWNLCTSNSSVMTLGTAISPAVIWWNSSSGFSATSNRVPISDNFLSTSRTFDTLTIAENLIPRTSSGVSSTIVSTNFYGGDIFSRIAVTDSMSLYGGNWTEGSKTGIFSLSFLVSTFSSTQTGFRAVRLLAA
jgi:hypothetical protein